MIDYKEFCDRFWLAANDKEQQQLYSYRFGKKSFFARSNWLSSDLSVAEPKAEKEEEGSVSIISSKAKKESVGVDSVSTTSTATSTSTSSATTFTSASTAFTPTSPSSPSTKKQQSFPTKQGGLGLDMTFAAGAKISLDTRHMADLSIQSAKLVPEQLEQGK